MCGLDSLLRWNGTGRAAVDDHADDDDGAADEPSEDEVADWVTSTDKELLVSSLIQHRVLLSFFCYFIINIPMIWKTNLKPLQYNKLFPSNISANCSIFHWSSGFCTHTRPRKLPLILHTLRQRSQYIDSVPIILMHVLYSI